MREGAVRFRHAVRVFALLHRIAAVLRGVHQLARQAGRHGLFRPRTRRRDEPANGQRLGALETVETRAKREPLGIFHDALNNIAPGIEVRSRRVGGATYQVPVEVRLERAQALAIRWLITAARNRSENTMAARLSGELMDAANNRGNAVKKREDTHRMAEANKAFAHYRW